MKSCPVKNSEYKMEQKPYCKQIKFHQMNDNLEKCNFRYRVSKESRMKKKQKYDFNINQYP